jgi:hypothetical protein
MNSLISKYELYSQTIIEETINDISKQFFDSHFFRIDNQNSIILNYYIRLLYTCLNPYPEIDYSTICHFIGITNVVENNILKTSFIINLYNGDIKLYITRKLYLYHTDKKEPTFIITLDDRIDNEDDCHKKLYIIMFLLISLLLITRLNNNSITDIWRLKNKNNIYEYRSINMNSIFRYIVEKLDIYDNNLEYRRFNNIMISMIDIILNNFVVKIINTQTNYISCREF